MSLAILFHFLRAQHVSDINIYIIRSLRLFSWITTLVVLFFVRYVLEFQCGWFGVVSVLQAEPAIRIPLPPTYSNLLLTHTPQSHLLHTHYTFNSLYSQPHNAEIKTLQSHQLHTHSTFNSLHSQPHNADIQKHKATCCTLIPHLIPSTHNHTMPIHKHTKPPAANSLHI